MLRYNLHVAPRDVLIPREDTTSVAVVAAGYAALNSPKCIEVVDLGCGSGVLGLGVASILLQSEASQDA